MNPNHPLNLDPKFQGSALAWKEWSETQARFAPPIPASQGSFLGDLLRRADHETREALKARLEALERLESNRTWGGSREQEFTPFLASELGWLRLYFQQAKS